MEEFRKEAKNLSTADLLLILEDQVDLYSEEELAILRAELDSRPENAFELEQEEQERREQEKVQEAYRKAAAEAQRAAQEAARRQEEQRKADYANKVNSLRQRGYNGHYEYTTLSLIDNDGGGLTPEKVTMALNSYALDGWKLVSAYSNELGHKSASGGIAGFSAGVNSTVDQHILILERFIRI